MTTSYLVTGANRGIGLGLIIELAKRSDVKIYATVRDPSRATDLQAVAEKHSNVSVLSWRADKKEDSAEVARVIEEEVGHLDVLIANAGVFSDPTPVLTTTSETFIHDFTVNAAGPLHLFQATAALLEKSSKAGGGVWAPISSCLGSIAEHPDMHALAYGASKAALNFTSKRISKEHKKIKVIIIHPGDVRTEMAQGVAKKAGFDEIPGTITVEESASQIVALTERSDKFDTGIFVDYKGDGMAW